MDNYVYQNSIILSMNGTFHFSPQCGSLLGKRNINVLVTPDLNGMGAVTGSLTTVTDTVGVGTMDEQVAEGVGSSSSLLSLQVFGSRVNRSLSGIVHV